MPRGVAIDSLTFGQCKIYWQKFTIGYDSYVTALATDRYVLFSYLLLDLD